MSRAGVDEAAAQAGSGKFARVAATQPANPRSTTTWATVVLNKMRQLVTGQTVTFRSALHQADYTLWARNSTRPAAHGWR